MTRHLAFAWFLTAMAVPGIRAQSPDPRPDLGRDAVRPVGASSTAAPTAGAPAAGQVDAARETFGDQAILLKTPAYLPFSLYGDGGVYFTDNAAISDHDRERDVSIRFGGGGSVNPRLARRLIASVSASEHFYRYDDFSELDFDLFEAGAGLLFIPPTPAHLDPLTRNTAIRLHYAYYRINESTLEGKLYDDHALVFNLQKRVPVSRTHQLIFDHRSSFSLEASNETARRNEFGLRAAYQVQLARRLWSVLSWRSAFYRYAEFGRTDWNHSANLTFIHELDDQLSLFGTAGYTRNESNFSELDYQRWDLGGNVGVEWKFGGPE